MKRYPNLSGHSGVRAYAIGPGSITVEFVGGERYQYTVASAGPAAVDAMQRLAKAGSGLSTFIAQHKPPYVRKEP